MKKILGIFLISVSVFIIIVYSNLLIMGYSLVIFFKYLLKCWEFYFFIIGIYLLKKDRF